MLDHATIVDPAIRYAPYTSTKRTLLLLALRSKVFEKLLKYIKFVQIPSWVTFVAKSAAVLALLCAVYFSRQYLQPQV